MSQVVIENYGKTKIRYTGIPLPLFPQALRHIQQAALTDVVLWWRENYAFLHFHASSFMRYGGLEPRVYESRWKNRDRRRLPTAESALPLVWKGNLRSRFLTGSVKTRAVGENATLKVTAEWPNLPPHVYYDLYGKDRNPGPKMYFELTIMRPDEEKRMAEKFSEFMQERLNRESEAAA
jgi:hypothetical protein